MRDGSRTFTVSLPLSKILRKWSLGHAPPLSGSLHPVHITHGAAHDSSLNFSLIGTGRGWGARGGTVSYVKRWISKI